MSDFQVHSIESAPEDSQPILKQTKEQYGFLPNLMGTLAEAPAATKGYTVVAEAFEGSSFSPVEQQIVLLTASYENHCHYCMAAHSTVAGMVKMPEDVLSALRDGEPLPDDKLQTLRETTRKMVDERGWLDDSDVQAFLDAGYTKGQLLEVIVGIAQKTISNYTNHIAETPVDDQFADQSWTHPEDREQRATA